LNQSKTARNLVVLANKIKGGMHRHFNREDRIALGALKRAGLSQSEIGRQLGFNRSSISRELKRNPKPRGGYHALNADVQATTRRQQSKQNYRKIDRLLGVVISSQLHPLVSPEVVAHRLDINHQTIYNWLYRDRRDLLMKLPQRGRKRRRYGSKRAKKQGWTRLVKRIHNRPVSDLAWEGDTVKGSTKPKLLTHVEQTSLYTRADLLPNGTADAVHATLKQTPLSGTITYDRGSEFALWQMIERDTNTSVFFADAHASWQRGKNENTNGRLRRVFPKRFNFATITQKQLDAVVYFMNHTERKSLGWKTPCSIYGRECCISD
jgi:IS30 family transposase